MTLRQGYARPRPRAITRHPDQAGPGRRSRTHRPRRDQPTASARPRRATAAATQPTKGQVRAYRRARPGMLPAPPACHRLDPRGVAT